jgi:5,6-dimethylbenzimidazole synthase
MKNLSDGMDTMREPTTFDEAFRAQLHELFVWRRDVRRFQTAPLPPGTLERLIDVACLSPSVGLSQPWRFVIVDDRGRRASVVDEFKSCNAEALQSYSGERAAHYAKLKLAGLAEAPSQFAVFADRSTDVGHGLGRRTMPEMIEYSAVSAICMMWLAARAEGIGMGWVSILDPVRVREILGVPTDWHFIGYFCLGYPQSLSSRPELECAGWESRRPSQDYVLRR